MQVVLVEQVSGVIGEEESAHEAVADCWVGCEVDDAELADEVAAVGVVLDVADRFGVEVFVVCVG